MHVRILDSISCTEKTKMANESEEQDSLMSIFGEWAQNTNVNGVPSVERAKHPLRKIVWLLLVLAGAGETEFYMTFEKVHTDFSHNHDIET